MNQKYTPGPWEWDSTVWNYDPQNDAPWLVQSVGINAILTGEIKCNKADAYLIAAAPDMLEALQDLFDCGMERMLMGDGKDDQVEAIAKARAAIAKAVQS